MKRSFIYDSTSFYAFLCIVFIPFPFNISKAQLSVTESLFGKLIGFLSKNVFGKPPEDTHVHSDTVAMYVLVLLLFVLAILLGLIVTQIKKWDLYREKVVEFIYRLAFYYLALQLLKYGLDKVFKNQFYLPEPNTLYTPLGHVPRDLLYWSSMGTSHFYNVFLGSMEVLAAIFILIRQTRLVGSLLSFFIMINVVAVNFGFDISVKLYSLFLLFFTLYLLIPYFRNLYQFFFTGHSVAGKRSGDAVILIRNRFLSGSLKWLAAGIILLEVLYPFIRSGNLDSDMAKRPYLHGAYEVTHFIAGPDTLEKANFPVKRFFIHKDSYMIFQDQEDAMTDYKLSYDPGKYVFILTDYQFHQTAISFSYQPTDSILTLHYLRGGEEYKLTGKALDWRKLPALKKEFHWTID